MNKLSYILYALLIGFLTTLMPLGQAEQKIRELDYVIAIVNDDVVTYSELQNRIRFIVRQLKEKNTRLPPQEILEKQILEQMIIEKIQLQLAEKEGIRVDDEAVNSILANIARNNGMTLEKFQAFLQKDGFNYEDFRENVHNEIVIKQLRQRRVDNRIHISEQEIENFLTSQKNRKGNQDEYNLGHILITLPESANAEQIKKAKQKAQEVLSRLRNGADFEQMAVAVSGGQQALKGGQLGWRKAAQLPTLFADIIPQIKVGGYSDIIRSASGFHIIKLQDKRSDTQKHIIQQTQARHILLRPNELRSNDDVRQHLQQLRVRIINGDDFASLARSQSDDKASAADGGSLGWVSPGMMVARFEEQMNKLKPGEVSQPFQTRFGWHIVQVLSRRTHDNTEEFQKQQARNHIKQRKIEEATENWLRRQRSEAYVEYRFNQ